MGGAGNAFDKGYKLYEGSNALYNVAQGNYGEAAAGIGDMGMYGALGGWYLPVMAGKGLYDGFVAPQDMELEEY